RAQLPGISVPCSRIISYCSGVRILRHSASVWVTAYCFVIVNVPSLLLDRQRIDRRPHCAGDWYGWRHEKEFVDFVLLAIVGEFLQIKYLAHGHAHDRDRNPVPGLVDPLLAFVRPDFTAPRVACKRRQLRILDEIERLAREPRRVPARIAVPASRFLTSLHHASTHDDIVAALEFGLLFFCGVVEIVIRNAVAIVERVDAFVARHVEKHAASYHPVLGLLDTAFLRAGRGHLATVVAVPHVVFIKHMAEPVPLRAALK